MLCDEVIWNSQQIREFAQAIDADTNILTHVVANLFELTRIHAGAVKPVLEVVSLDELTHRAVVALGSNGARAAIDIPEDLPLLSADPGFLERA